MESWFGASFSTVRVHIDKAPAILGVAAFAWGEHLYFAPGVFAPETPRGRAILIHELTHVIQRYRKTPGWVTEGVADYIRWAIYEGKPLKDFHCPDTADGYTKGYRITAGFFLWLETDPAPGIVSRMNAASRKGEFTDKVFQDMTGQTLQQLWDRYRAERKAE